MHAQGQAVAGGVDPVDHRVELVALPADHVQHRPEDFLVQLAQVLQLIRARCEEGAVGGFCGQLGGGDQACFAVHAHGVVLQDLQCIGVDHRADVGGQQARVADLQFLHRTSQHGHHLVGDVVLHEQHARGRATLAGGGEGRTDGVLDQLFRQCRGVGDEGVLATGLGNQHADGGVAGGHRAVDRTRGVGGAGEGHAGHARVGGQRGAVEIGFLDADHGVHPPVTGSNTATSSPGRIGAVGLEWVWLMASFRRLAGSSWG
ncbi:hypothetical protein G6F57_013328 [Rhizopus arrhizus]|nr:hypothetical protein G6F57_013328 [Rhizopus arrhizus]